MKGAQRAADRIDEAPLDGMENRRLYVSKAQRALQTTSGVLRFYPFRATCAWFYLILKISFQIFSYLGYSLISSTPRG